jgi:UDP:flavonoid glycosyltransferase YjiC (YdhE family)
MLVLAKASIEKGYEVHFRSMKSVREKILDTGALFHSAEDTQPEFYEGRQLNGALGALDDLMEEHGLEKSSFLSILKVLNVSLEQQLPGSLRLLCELNPNLVVYDALMLSRDVMFASKVMKIPAVGVWTLAGPGAWVTHSVSTMLPLTLGDAHSHVKAFQPHVDATARMNNAYGLELCPGLPEPVGKVDFCSSNTILVTTSSDLQDPLAENLASSYRDDGANFVFVGPLLANILNSVDAPEDGIARRVRLAQQQGRPVVLISMGTLLVSDHSLNGWEGRSGNSSLKGRDLCHAVWTGSFDAFKSDSADTGALLVMSLGPRSNPLESIEVPPNAICAPLIAQQAVLTAGVDVFLTHGGQNSFTEAMMYATPIVVCPGFGDQVVNSHKAESLGVGIKVDRPHGDLDGTGEVAMQYRRDVREALLEVYAKRQHFAAAAAACKVRLQKAGGLSVALETFESVSEAGKQAQVLTPTTIIRSAGA